MDYPGLERCFHFGPTNSLEMAHVGSPTPVYEVRLVDIPEMDYRVTDREHMGVPVVGRGEVLYRGPCTMKAYFGMEQKSKETKDADGWIHTGDVGAWLPSGLLSIIDRRSAVFKLAQGEYVSPEKVERAVCRCPLVMNAFVFGTPLNSRLVAVCVANPEALDPALNQLGVDKKAQPDAVRKLVLGKVQAACRDAGLLGFEVPASIVLLDPPGGFTVDTGVLTATFKIVRHRAKEVFAQHIKDMYAELGEDVKV